MTDQTTGPATAGDAFARALADAMARRNLTLERIQARLADAGTPVSVATLSYWRTGRSVPRRRASLRAVQNLEQVVGLEPGALQQLLPVAGAHTENLALTCTAPNDAARMLDVFDLTFTQPLHVLRYVAELQLPGQPDEAPITQLSGRLRVVGATVTRLPMVTPLGADGSALRVHGAGGVRVGREFRDHARGILVGELLLPRAYRDQEQFEVNGTLTGHSAAADDDHFEWGLPAAADEFVLRVRFGGMVPRRVEHYTRSSPSPGAARQAVGEVPLRAGVAQVTVRDASAGIHGLRWSW